MSRKETSDDVAVVDAMSRKVTRDGDYDVVDMF